MLPKTALGVTYLQNFAGFNLRFITIEVLHISLSFDLLTYLGICPGNHNFYRFKIWDLSKEGCDFSTSDLMSTSYLKLQNYGNSNVAVHLLTRSCATKMQKQNQFCGKHSILYSCNPWKMVVKNIHFFPVKILDLQRSVCVYHLCRISILIFAMVSITLIAI